MPVATSSSAEVRVDPLDRAEQRAGEPRERGADDERQLPGPDRVDAVAARERLVRHHGAHREADAGEADDERRAPRRSWRPRA